ncbi:MAG: tRNA-His guanylyltransferase [Candelina submexicana]|nr:MAG: tRNA-His guanylyltransferase [Candelina submexicana]
MANSKYEYVRTFERPDHLLPNTWIVIRIDGRGFHKLSAKYAFEKPNDRRALDLMNTAASAVMNELPDIVVGYGVSDEYSVLGQLVDGGVGSFVLHQSCILFERRESKLLTTVVSTFTSYYVHLWPSFFPDTPLSPPLPSFDGRVVLYPSARNLRDYLNWRQVDCKVFTPVSSVTGRPGGGSRGKTAELKLGGLDAKEAEKELLGSHATDKNEILFSRFMINYNNEPEMYKKGSVVFRDYKVVEADPMPPKMTKEIMDQDEDVDQIGVELEKSKTQQEKDRKRRAKARITVQYVDIIKDEFWERRPWLLSNKPGKIPKEP